MPLNRGVRRSPNGVDTYYWPLKLKRCFSVCLACTKSLLCPQDKTRVVSCRAAGLLVKNGLLPGSDASSGDDQGTPASDIWRPKSVEMLARNTAMDGESGGCKKRFDIVRSGAKPASTFLLHVLEETVGKKLDVIPREEVLGFNALVRALGGGSQAVGLETAQAKTWLVLALEGIWCEDMGLSVCPWSTTNRMFKKIGAYTKVTVEI